VSMPKASVNKNDFVLCWKDQIRFARKPGVMEKISVAHAMYETADSHLRQRVLALDQCHSVASVGSGERVGHNQRSMKSF
jgi:hypothetical protein